MRTMLIARIPEARRALINVVVFDSLPDDPDVALRARGACADRSNARPGLALAAVLAAASRGRLLPPSKEQRPRPAQNDRLV